MAIRNRIVLVLSFLAASHSIIAQCNDWEKLFYYKFVSVGDAAHDRFGNTYIIGSFSKDGFSLGSNTFNLPIGGQGVFIAKYDKNGSIIWATSPTVGYRAFGRDIEVDSDDNIIVAGEFDTSIAFSCLSFPGSGRLDVFVAKLMSDGTPVWLTGSTGVDDSSVEGLHISSNGNCIVIGNFVEKSDVTAGLAAPDMKIGDMPVVTGADDQVNGGYDSYVASINPNGTVAWTQGIGGDGNAYDYVVDATTDSKNNVIVTGYFNSDQISFDGHLVHGFTVSENYYLAKINPQGQTLWVRETEGGIDQGGWGVDVDANDNIFVAGRFYGDAKFGSITLQGKGQSDVFIVKLTPEGATVAARSIGNDGFDAGTGLEVNGQGKVLLSAYYYSTYLEVGTFSSIKTDLTGADSFTATLSNDLATVECANFITGDGESIIWNFELDSFDNSILSIGIMAGPGSEVKMGAETFADADVWSVVAVLGNNPATDEGETQAPVFPTISLGRDTTLCLGQKLVLAVPLSCNAGYMWSTGSTETQIEVTIPGVYWVDVTWGGATFHDEIVVSYYESIDIDLGNDLLICPGESVSWNLPVYENASYKWSDGSISTENAAMMPGSYWVEVSNHCETVRATITLEAKPAPVVDLGNDVVACNSDVVLSYTPAAGETLRWPDGSTLNSFRATESGTFQLTVYNGCVETTDEVEVTIKNPTESVIPNVVTVNNDGKNDHFVLPYDGGGYSLSIFNRWGEEVFYANQYENNWPSSNLSTGVYFYSLHGECIPELKGTIHVME